VADSSSFSPSEGEAFAQYVRQDQKHLKTFVWTIVNNDQDAEDIVQETLIKVMNQWHTPLQNPARFARTVARNLALDHVRQRRRRPEYVEFQSGQHDPVEPVPELTGQAQQVLQALDALTPSQREALAWRADGYKPAEIAEHTGLKPSTVRSHISQGFKRLRREMSLRPQSAEGKEVSDG